MNKIKLLNIALVLSSMLGYLQWGDNNSVILFKAEAEVIFKLFTDPGSAAHPFTLVPLFGQVFLIITLFQNTPDPTLTYIGMSCIGFLLLFILFIGIISLSLKVIVSTLPFVCLSIFQIVHLRKNRSVH